MARGLAAGSLNVASWNSRRMGGHRCAAPTPNPSQSPGAGTAAALYSKGTTPMMYDLALPAAVPTIAIIALAVVYLISEDPELRARAWQLLKLLLRR